MTMSDLPAVEAAFERYVSVWNETDPERRRALVAELWAPDASYANASALYRGHDEIVAGITGSHERWVGSGHRFAVATVAGAHHGVARLVWHMLGPDGDEPVTVGTSVVTFDADGRIRSDMQFIDR